MVDNNELEKIIGKENVHKSPEILEEYSRDESFAFPVRPRCVVRPGSVDEVQALVAWANRTGTPLIPVSSSSPRFHGDTVPSIGGAVIIDMSRMNKVIRVDRRNRISMVEPGVTYGELIPALEKEGLAPFLPLSPRSTKSVLGSLLEREPITMPRYHWDMQDPLMCMEVVFGNGEIFRTGSAAGPGTLEEQWAVGKAQSRPMGPAYTDFAKCVQGAQGTMGITTWVSILARPLPEIKRPYQVPSDKLERALDLMYKINWKRIGQDALILNGAQFARLVSKDGESAAALQKEAPPWIVIFSIEGYGTLPEERVAYQHEEFMETAQLFGLEPKPVVAGVRAGFFKKILSQPSDDPYWKTRARGGCHDIFFLTTMDKTPGFLAKMKEIASDSNYSPSGIGVYIQPTVLGTSCHCEFSLPFDPEDEDDKKRVRELDDRAARTFANMGAFFYRPYDQWADYAYAHAADTVMVQRKMKNDLFDPNGIMNPGKLCF